MPIPGRRVRRSSRALLPALALAALLPLGCSLPGTRSAGVATLPEHYRHSVAALGWPGAHRAFQVGHGSVVSTGECALEWRLPEAGEPVVVSPVRFERDGVPVAHWSMTGPRERVDFEAAAAPRRGLGDTSLVLSVRATVTWLAPGPGRTMLEARLATRPDGPHAVPWDAPAGSVHAEAWRGREAVRDGRTVARVDGDATRDAASPTTARPARTAGDGPGRAGRTLSRRGSSTAGRRHWDFVVPLYPVPVGTAALARVRHERVVAEARRYWRGQLARAASLETPDTLVNLAWRAALVTLRRLPGARLAASGCRSAVRSSTATSGCATARASCARWPSRTSRTSRARTRSTLAALPAAGRRAPLAARAARRHGPGAVGVRAGGDAAALGGDGARLPAGGEGRARLDPAHAPSTARLGLPWGACCPTPTRATASWSAAASSATTRGPSPAAAPWPNWPAPPATTRWPGPPTPRPATTAPRSSARSPARAIPTSRPRGPAPDATGATPRSATRRACSPRTTRGSRRWRAACARRASRPASSATAPPIRSTPTSAPTSRSGRLLAGRPAEARAWLAGVLAHSSATLGQAEIVARDGGFGANLPPHATAAAALVDLLRNMLVGDARDTLELAAGAPLAWWSGTRLERAPTRFGVTSVRLDRPAAGVLRVRLEPLRVPLRVRVPDGVRALAAVGPDSRVRDGRWVEAAAGAREIAFRVEPEKGP